MIGDAAGKVGGVEVEPGEFRSGESGAPPVDGRHPRRRQVAVGEIRAGKIRPREIGPPEIHADEARTGEIGRRESGLDEPRSREIRGRQHGSREVRAAEIDTREIGPGQVEARKVGSGEVHRPPAAARRLGHVHGAIRQPGKHAGRCGGLTSLRPRRLLRFTGGQHLLGGGLHRSHLIEQLELSGRG